MTQAHELVGAYNIRGLLNCVEQVSLLGHRENIQVLDLTETWLKANKPMPLRWRHKSACTEQNRRGRVSGSVANIP